MNKDGGFFGIDPAGEIIERHFRDVGTHLFGIVEIVGEGLRIRNHDINFIVFSAVLQFYSALQGPDVMPDMQFSRRSVARQNDIFHKNLSFPKYPFERYYTMRPPRLSRNFLF